MMRKIVNGALVAAFLFIGLIGYQLYGVMADTEEQRLAAINDWASGSHNKGTIAEQFVEACMKGRPVDIDSQPEKLVSIYECANEVGGSELEGVVRTADRKTEAPAPLRWL